MRLVRAEILATAFATGAAVILIEILGTRVIGPVFGVNLFVWAALLATTLGSLAAGYYVGGVWIDRSPTRRVLGFVVAGAGILLAGAPLLAHVVLRSAESLGPAAGSLVAAIALFAPCLVALGTIGPIAVRLSVLHVGATGHGVGYVYAVSTAGSLAGTFVTGFVLIPMFETDAILFGAAACLTTLGVVLLVVHWRRAAVGIVGVPLLAVAGSPAYPLPTGIQVLDRSQSLYGLVEVIEDQSLQVRLLRVDHSVIGAQFKRDHSSGFAFTHLLEAVRFLRPFARNVLQIGLGTGTLPMALRSQDVTTDVVEIDPAVVDFARRYFGFASRGDVHEEDARTFLRRTTRRYDVIVHDTFTGGTTPENLLSVEVVRRIHDVLNPDGVLVLNFVGYHDGPNVEASWLVARTISAVFSRVRAFADESPEDEPRGAGNLVFFASDGPLAFTIPIDAHFENEVCRHVQLSFQQWEVLQHVPFGPVISDARNPLARLQMPVAREHFEAMNKLLPVEVWLQ